MSKNILMGTLDKLPFTISVESLRKNAPLIQAVLDEKFSQPTPASLQQDSSDQVITSSEDKEKIMRS